MFAHPIGLATGKCSIRFQRRRCAVSRARYKSRVVLPIGSGSLFGRQHGVRAHLPAQGASGGALRRRPLSRAQLTFAILLFGSNARFQQAARRLVQSVRAVCLHAKSIARWPKALQPDTRSTQPSIILQVCFSQLQEAAHHFRAKLADRSYKGAVFFAVCRQFTSRIFLCFCFALSCSSAPVRVPQVETSCAALNTLTRKAL